MYRRTLNYLRGYMRVRLPNPAGVNALAGEDIPFWKPEAKGNEAEVYILRYSLQDVMSLVPEAEVVQERGLFKVCRSLKKRLWLIIPLAVLLVAVWAASMFIWEINVYGNEEVPSWKILSVLKSHGVKIGTFGLSVDSETLSNEILLDIPELSWFAININGSRSSGARLEHAMGDIYARTEYELCGTMPLITYEKVYTGRENKRYAVIIGEKRINLYSDSKVGFENCDKTVEERSLSLPGGGTLPIVFITEIYREYELSETKRDTEECREVLEFALYERLYRENDGGQVLAADFDMEVDEDSVTVTMRAECYEQIGVVRPMSDQEISEGLTEAENEEAEQ